MDFGRAARDYAPHRTGFPDSFRDRLAAMGIGQTRQQILDLATGTGTLAGCGAVVTGVDISRELLAEA